MAHVHQKTKSRPICFKSIRILKDARIGHGAYGTVYKALCDDLLECAAKVLHQELILTEEQAQELEHSHLYAQAQAIPVSQAHRLPIRRFNQECEFMSLIRHPNIVLFLGVSQDPVSNLPVLLMELMDGNLTVFLEGSEALIPFHTQVSICHDIALAISYLHSNGIIHRDLSSNNILMMGDRRAKVTDFGMAVFEDMHRDTQTPGTAAYMPPEAKRSKSPLSCCKTDVFSIGVLIIQIVTRLFPQPSEELSNSLWSSWMRFEPEIERRQNHIGLIEKDHPLLRIVHDCLKLGYKSRPTSSEVCSQVGALKNKNFMVKVKPGASQAQPIPERGDIQPCREGGEKRRRLNSGNPPNYEPYSKMEVDDLVKRIVEENVDEEFEVIDLKDMNTRPFEVTAQVSDVSEAVGMTWQKRGQKAPVAMHRMTDCVVIENLVYFLHGQNCTTLYSFYPRHFRWSEEPHPPVEQASLAVVNGRVVLVGGKYSNKLYSLIDGSWENKIHSMPTKRHSAITASSASHLIVIGGIGKGGKYIRAVEILDTDTHQWSTVISFPEPCAALSACVCGSNVYVLGNFNCVFSCGLEALINSQGISLTATITGRGFIWERVKELPVSSATCIAVHNTLYAVAGKLSNGVPTTAVYRYDSSNKSWCVHSHLNTARSQCFVAVTECERDVIVVGGVTESGEPLETIERARWPKL